MKHRQTTEQVVLDTANFATGGGVAPPSPLLAVPNVTAHPSTVSVPTSYFTLYYSVWHYNCL